MVMTLVEMNNVWTFVSDCAIVNMANDASSVRKITCVKLTPRRLILCADLLSNR